MTTSLAAQGAQYAALAAAATTIFWACPALGVPGDAVVDQSGDIVIADSNNLRLRAVPG